MCLRRYVSADILHEMNDDSKMPTQWCWIYPKIVFCSWNIALSNNIIIVPPVSVLVSMEINRRYYFRRLTHKIEIPKLTVLDLFFFESLTPLFTCPYSHGPLQELTIHRQIDKHITIGLFGFFSQHFTCISSYSTLMYTKYGSLFNQPRLKEIVVS